MADVDFDLCERCQQKDEETLFAEDLVKKTGFSLGRNRFACVHLIRCEGCKELIGDDPEPRPKRWTESQDRYAPGGYTYSHARCVR